MFAALGANNNMSSKILFVVFAGSMGVFFIIFTNKAAKLLSIFMQLSSKSSGSSVDLNQTWARPAFIRLAGLVQIGMAVFVYFGKLGT